MVCVAAVIVISLSVNAIGPLNVRVGRLIGFDELAHKTFLCSVAITEIAIET